VLHLEVQELHGGARGLESDEGFREERHRLLLAAEQDEQPRPRVHRGPVPGPERERPIRGVERLRVLVRVLEHARAHDLEPGLLRCERQRGGHVGLRVLEVPERRRELRAQGERLP
jgi:hypothetical protein